MGSPASHSWLRSVPLKESSDSTPLKDVVICCTSVPDDKRVILAAYAKDMGAIHRFDLTLDVTHLIVGEYDTPKYRYVAKERPDVKPMTIEWLEAVRELWINDQEIDIEALEKRHTLPTLTSLRFSMTGCDDPIERSKISEQIRANGATYEGDLTKQITHLISFRTEGAKYKAAKSWGLKIVSIEWLRDSLERGMILNEALYDPALPPEERGKDAWDRTKPKRTSLGKRSRGDSATNPEGPKRRLRRTASSKLGSQNESMWGDIVGGGSVPQVMRSGVWETNDDTQVATEPAEGRDSAQVPKAQRSEAVAAEAAQGIFSRCRFYFDGFDRKKSEILTSHLVPHGAELAATIEELQIPPPDDLPLRLFRVTPSNLPASEYRDLPSSNMPIQAITEWWVERCLHHKAFMEPEDLVIGRPFPKHPVEGFSDLIISTSAFTGIDLLHVKKAVILLGGAYSEDMTPKSSVLVTQSLEKLRKDKLEHAYQWGIPIVTSSWLWESISAGKLLPLQNYLCSSKRTESTSTSGKSGSKGIEQHKRAKSNVAMPVSRSDSSSSSRSARLDNSKLDRTALDSTEVAQPFTVRTEINDSNSSTGMSVATEPLSEIHNNACASAVSTAPAPTNHPAPPAREEIHNALSSLLAKAKTSGKPEETETTEGRRRGANRILGRAASNISTGSASFSRASSVDSTATHGRPVQYPPYSNNSGHTETSETTDERIKKFANASDDRNKDASHSPPPAPTQILYEDPEGKEYQERARAKMMGEKFDDGEGRKTRLKEKSITLGDVSAAAIGTRQKTRSRREKAPHVSR